MIRFIPDEGLAVRRPSGAFRYDVSQDGAMTGAVAGCDLSSVRNFSDRDWGISMIVNSLEAGVDGLFADVEPLGHAVYGDPRRARR